MRGRQSHQGAMFSYVSLEDVAGGAGSGEASAAGDPVWHPTVLTRNRNRLFAGDVAGAFLGTVVAHARVKGLLSDEHFSVDGTLIEAWASVKSFRPKDGGNPDLKAGAHSCGRIRPAATRSP